MRAIIAAPIRRADVFCLGHVLECLEENPMSKPVS